MAQISLRCNEIIKKKNENTIGKRDESMPERISLSHTHTQHARTFVEGIVSNQKDVSGMSQSKTC